jgi:enoyl-CoA hydratase
VVIIAGRPGKFSAGFDLAVMGAGGETMLDLLRKGAGVSQRLVSFPTPVILAASGHALAMGALLLLSADYRIGINGAYKIGLNEVAIGMTLPWFGVELAKARLAPVHLERAVSLATLYDPAGAVAAGFLDEAVEETELLPRAVAMAEQFAALNLEAHHGSKVRTREQLIQALEGALDKEFS